MSPATWRPLPLPRTTLPHLLTSTHFASSSYTIHMTDLANLWTESLDRRPIILRALKEDASIDPSDGEENMASFLKCLRAAFDPSDSIHRLTTVSLSTSDGDGPAGRDGLVLTATCELPKELSSKPLTWHMYLRKQSPEATATELVLPLAESHLAQRSRIEALAEIIRQKDALASKMLDKFEATGTPLEHVFTALGTRRKVSREQAEARVKGLAPFDLAAWEAGYCGVEEGGVDGVVEGVFGKGLEYKTSEEAGRYAEGLGNWWRDMGSVGSGPREDDRESTVGKRSAPSSLRESQGKSPPRQSPGGSKDREAEATASETGSEDEAPKPKPARRLGAIGGAKPKPKPKPEPKAQAPPPDDEATASESDGDAGGPLADRNVPEPSLPKSPEPLPVREQARSPPGSATAFEDEEPARPSPAKRGRGGLGKIGGAVRPRKETSESAEGSEEAKEKVKEEVKPERKVIARPVKKKRKF